MNSGTFWIRTGALLGGLAVAAGAFGTHSLKVKLEPKYFEIFETAARYQMYHALAILAVGVLVVVQGPSRTSNIAGWTFLLGTVVFSGSLYALVGTGITKLGAITPIGGVLMIVGWLALALTSTKSLPIE